LGLNREGATKFERVPTLVTALNLLNERSGIPWLYQTTDHMIKQLFTALTMATVFVAIPANADDIKTYPIGQEFILGDYTYKITSSKITKAIGSNEFARQKASDESIFLVVAFTIKNNTKQTQTVMADDFKIKDSQDREFSPSSDANTALTMSGDGKDFMFSQLQPGLTKKQVVAFEIPVDDVKSKLSVLVPEKGFFSSGKALIAIQ
jgi:hypothetical protein